MRNISKIVIAAVVVLALAYAAFAFDWVRTEKVDDFATCAAAGYPVAESSPRQCRDASGNAYVEEIPGKTQGNPMIEVDSPKEGGAVSSPVSITGRARGPWYSEASFPIEIVGADGKIVGNGIATAQGEWMTQDFVPFSASITFDPGANATGTIRLKRDNPSGLPQNDDSVEIPVAFARGSAAQAACKPSGCGGEICSDEDVVSNCIYKPEFACYKSAKCERQSNGKCGWTETAGLATCIKSARMAQ